LINYIMSIQNILSPNHYNIFAEQIGDSSTPVGDVWLTDINGSPYNPGPGPVPTLVANKFLRTNSTPAMLWDDITPSDIIGGSNNQFIGKRAGTIQFTNVLSSDITPGTANQILVTNSGATASTFASNIQVPGTLGVTGASTFTGNGLFSNDCQITNDLNIVNGDVTLANGDLDILVGGLTVEGPTLLNDNLDIDGVLSFNGVAGSSGNIIISNGAGQTWASPSFSPSTITAGTNGYLLKSVGGVSTWTAPALTNISGTLTNNQVLQSDGAGAAVYNTNVTLPGTLTVPSTTNLQGDLQLAGVSGSSGSFLKKTGASTQAFTNLAASDVKGGSNNQVMISNGTNGVFSDNLSLPGTLGVTGASTLSGNLVMNGVSAIFQMSGGSAVALLNDTRIYGPLKFSGVAGILGTVPVSDASGIPTWSYPQYFVHYFDSNVVDMNNGGGGALNLLQNASPNVTNSNITYTSGAASRFTVAEAGNYQVLFQTNATTVGVGAQTLINIKINGLYAGSYTTIVVPGIQSVVLQKTYKLTAASYIEIVSQELSAGIINTSAADANAIATTNIFISRIGAYI
jgi:hypothetical protein